MTNRAGAGLALSLLFAINTVNFFDRQILGAVAELVRKDGALSDTAMGSLGTAFTLLHAGGRLIRHARYFIRQLAESYVTPTLFRQILGRIE